MSEQDYTSQKTYTVQQMTWSGPTRTIVHRSASLPPAEMIKLEENYLHQTYDYKTPAGESPVLIATGGEESLAPMPTLILTIKLEEDKTETIEIQENDPPLAIASMFCRRHGLDEEVQTALVSKIEESIANLQTEERASGITPMTYSRVEPYQKVSCSTVSRILNDISQKPEHRDKYEDNRKSRLKFLDEIQKEISGSLGADCTFKPKLSQRSEMLAKEKSRRMLSPNQGVHDRLYQDAISRKKSAAMLSSSAFSPPPDSLRSQSPLPRAMSPSVEEPEPGDDTIQPGQVEEEQTSQMRASQFLSTTSILQPNGGVTDISMSHYSLATVRMDTSHYSGQRMYLNSAKNQHERDLRLKKKKKELEDKQVEEATFKPHINARSRKMLPNRQNKFPDPYAMLEAENIRKAKLELIREREAAKAKAETPFRPQLNKTTKAKARKREDTGQVLHEKLYQEAKRKERERDENIRKSSELFSFQPSISRGPREGSTERVHERLYSSFVKDLSVTVERSMAIETIPERRPHITRGPKKGHRSVGDNEKVRSASLEQRRVQETNKFIQITREKNYDMRRSQEILEKVKQQRLAELFAKLDADNDGLISEHSVDITGLSHIELKAVEPVLVPLEHTGSLMSFVQFESEINNLLPHLEPELKHALIGPHHSRKMGSEPLLSFQPKINQKSSSLANLRNSQRTSQGNIWGFLNAEQKTIDGRKKENENIKVFEEMKGCTFAPDITPSPLFRSTHASFRSDHSRFSPKNSNKVVVYPANLKGPPKRQLLLPEGA